MFITPWPTSPELFYSPERIVDGFDLLLCGCVFFPLPGLCLRLRPWCPPCMQQGSQEITGLPGSVQVATPPCRCKLLITICLFTPGPLICSPAVKAGANETQRKKGRSNFEFRASGLFSKPCGMLDCIIVPDGVELCVSCHSSN